MATTLKTLVQKTATVTSVKLATPADRIGLGLVNVATYPADVLSPGQFPLPHNPGSEPNLGSRTERSAAQMHGQMRGMARAVPQAGTTGCPVPGSSARRRPWSFTVPPSAGWQRVAAKRSAAAGRVSGATGLTARAATTNPDAVASRASFPAVPGHPFRLGCDCQSPDRGNDRTPATGETTPTATAGK
jgi:hypothetical protein